MSQSLYPVTEPSHTMKQPGPLVALLAVLLLLVAGAMMAYSGVAEHQYLQKLQVELARLEPAARRAQVLDRSIDATRARTRLLDDFRARSKADLDALNELTRLLPPPTWTNQVELSRETATFSGETEQAAALLGVIDSSPMFHNSEFSVIQRGQSGEIFRIRTQRGAKK